MSERIRMRRSPPFTSSGPMTQIRQRERTQEDAMPNPLYDRLYSVAISGNHGILIPARRRTITP